MLHLIPLHKSITSCCRYITSWVTQFILHNEPKIYNAICKVLRFGSNISAPILIFGSIYPFRQKFLFEFIVKIRILVQQQFRLRECKMIYPPCISPCYIPSARWATGTGRAPKRKTKRLVHLKGENRLSVNLNPCTEVKNSAKLFVNVMSCQTDLQICHFAEMNWTQPATIQSEH
jgi:hypothetical protein